MRATAPLLLAITLLASPAGAASTLYDDLGGHTGVASITERTTTLILADKRVKNDFDDINLDRFKGRLRDFICQVADGPCTYKGRTMTESHKGLDVTDAKFNAVAEDLQTAMQQAGVPYWTQNRLMARLAPTRRDMVHR